jgi:16S rRNA U1498 N3-methylase RsmE
VNIVLLDETDFIAVDRVRLTDRRLRHVREVHRAAVGDALQVGLIDGEIGVGTVIELDDAALVLDVPGSTAAGAGAVRLRPAAAERRAGYCRASRRSA